jgi:hypothetical protein
MQSRSVKIKVIAQSRRPTWRVLACRGVCNGPGQGCHIRVRGIRHQGVQLLKATSTKRLERQIEQR